MPRLKRSLLFKLILAFWVVSILGIVAVAFLAGRVSQQEFSRFVNERNYQSLVDKLSIYYTEKGNFTGADYLLVEAQSLQLGGTREYLVVNPEGLVELSLAQHIPPSFPSPDMIRFGYPIYSNNLVVGYLIPLRVPRSPDDTATDNLRRLNLNLFIGVLVTSLIALISGSLIAGNIIRPVRDLNEATRAIAAGDLEKQVNITSRDEIGDLADSFNQMTASLKRSRDLRRQMTADIAHELRNPLSIILGNAEALSEGVLPATPESLYVIYDEARHLSRLVDDLRTLSLSESGELLLQRSRISAQEILEHCASLYTLRAAEKGISIQVQVDADLESVDVDAERIQQVLANLVENSLRYTPRGGTITLSACADSASARVNLAVEDTGEGIPPEDLPFIFERFYRSKHGARRLQEGSGLGLAISRALVELHGGRIFAASQPGRGARISISLPV